MVKGGERQLTFNRIANVISRLGMLDFRALRQACTMLPVELNRVVGQIVRVLNEADEFGVEIAIGVRGCR